MPSGSVSERRRAPARPAPRAPQKGDWRKRQASPRVLIAAGAAIVLIVLAVVLAVVLGGRSSNSQSGVPALGSLVNGLPGSAAAYVLFEGVPQHGDVLGSPSAPVTMVEFVDPQCPYCGQFETQVLPTIVQRFVRTGRVRIKLEAWAFIGADSARGQAAELAAAEQNRMFDYTEVLYANQRTENTGWLSDGMVAAIAESIPGLRVHALLQARGSAVVQAAQKQVAEAVTAAGVDQTPTIFVGRTGTQGAQVAMASATDSASLIAAINSVLG